MMQIIKFLGFDIDSEAHRTYLFLYQGLYAKYSHNKECKYRKIFAYKDGRWTAWNQVPWNSSIFDLVEKEVNTWY